MRPTRPPDEADEFREDRYAQGTKRKSLGWVDFVWQVRSYSLPGPSG